MFLSDTTAVGSNPGKDTLLLYSYPTDRSHKRSRKGAVKDAPTKGAHKRSRKGAV